jgi:diacylglycerol kinase
MQAFLKRVRYALQGWRYFVQHETNGQLQLLIAVAVVIAGVAFGISRHEWLWVLGCIALVLSLEMLNSSLEKLADALHPGQHPLVGLAKDLAAGAVLWAAVISAVIGIIIFWPYCQRWLA